MKCLLYVLDFGHSFGKVFTMIKEPAPAASDPENLITQLKSNITN